MPCSMRVVPPGWRSHEEIIAWQLSSELKNRVYALIDADARIQRDERFRDHLQGAVSSAPRLIAEGFGRYLPGDFSGYLRKANGELKETLECLNDGVDRGYFTRHQIVPLQRLCKRASKAATGLIGYLKTAKAPNEEPRPRRRTREREPREPRTCEPREPRTREPREPLEQQPSEPPEPPEPMELMEPMD
jgi:four helix bundle protein